MAATIPVLFVSLIVHGRLSYPIYGIRVRTPDIAELIVSIYYGAMHAFAILFSIATLLLSLAMKRGAFGAKIAYLGFATAAFDLMNAYPEVIGPVWGLVSSMFFSAWFVAVGLRLHKMTLSGRAE